METIIKSILKEKNNKELLLGNLAIQDKNNREKRFKAQQKWAFLENVVCPLKSVT